MGTRGAFGFIAGEVEKVAYNHFDSYPDGKGVEILQWIRQVVADGKLDEIRQQAAACRIVSDDVRPTPEDIAALTPYSNLGVSNQSTDDWYCLTHATHGNLGAMLACGYIEDNASFPLDSLFCEWAYIVDLDAEVFEVYTGFQKSLPKSGRWAGRPTKAEDKKDYEAHIAWCKENGRDPWQPKVSQHKAVELLASWPFNELPTDEEFLDFFRLARARETVADGEKYPEEVRELLAQIKEEDLEAEGKLYAAEWSQIYDDALKVVSLV